MQVDDFPNDERGSFGEWFARHQRILALICTTGVLLSLGVVVAFLASGGGDQPRTPFDPAARATDIAFDDTTESPSPSPSRSSSTTASTSASASASPSATASPAVSSRPRVVPRPSDVPGGRTRRPGPSSRPTVPPTSTPTKTPSERLHSLEIEVTGERTFVGVRDGQGRVLISRRMTQGERFAVAEQDWLRVFIEERASVRIVVDGQVRPIEGDPEGRLLFTID